VSDFAPQALVVPLGLDTFEGDPISGFKLRSADYLQEGRAIAELGLPTVLTFEGGYAVAKVGGGEHGECARRGGPLSRLKCVKRQIEQNFRTDACHPCWNQGLNCVGSASEVDKERLVKRLDAVSAKT